MSRMGCAIALGASLSAAPARAEPRRSEAPSRDERPKAEPRGELGVTPLLAVGLLPKVASGASFSATLGWPHVSVALEARLLSSLGAPSPDDLLVGASTTAAALSVCGRGSALFACVVLEMGEIRPEGERVLRIEARNPFSSSVGLRGGGAWSLSELLAVQVFVEAHAQSGRPSVWVNNVEAWSASPVFGVVGAGLVLPLDRL